MKHLGSRMRSNMRATQNKEQNTSTIASSHTSFLKRIKMNEDPTSIHKIIVS
jgi:hypothetical protein